MANRRLLEGSGSDMSAPDYPELGGQSLDPGFLESLGQGYSKTGGLEGLIPMLLKAYLQSQGSGQLSSKRVMGADPLYKGPSL